MQDATDSISAHDGSDLGIFPDVFVPPISDVEVLITADNAYGFGYGDIDALSNYFGGVENILASEIFNCPVGLGPEAYTVPAKDAAAGDYLYLIAYSDENTTQGIIAQFQSGTAILYTGEGDWEVCATGQDFDPGLLGASPSLAVINAKVTLCNAGKEDPNYTSGGWVDVAGTDDGQVVFGETNDTAIETTSVAGNEFPIVCGIDAAARWMWFNWDPKGIVWPDMGSPFLWPAFATTNLAKEFLIFRLRAEEITID